MTVNKDIYVSQGAVHEEIFTIETLTDPTLPYDQNTNPYIPLDLTVASIQMQVRQTFTSSTVLLTATDLNGKFVKTDPTHGIFTLTISPTDTSLIKFNSLTASYPYDIFISFSASNVIKVAYGQFIIEREVTKIT